MFLQKNEKYTLAMTALYYVSDMHKLLEFMTWPVYPGQVAREAL